MTTIATIFDEARACAPQSVPNRIAFSKLNVGGRNWHGQINIAKDDGYNTDGNWVVTIYLLCPRSKPFLRDEQADSFQHRAKTPSEALAQVEWLVRAWAQALGSVTP